MKLYRLFFALLTTAFALPLVAQESDWDRQYRIWLEGSQYYADRIEQVLEIFDARHAGQHPSYANQPEKYAVSDVDGDGKPELWLRTWDGSYGTVLTQRAGKVVHMADETPGNRLSYPLVNPDSMLWTGVDEMTHRLTPENDITMRYAPRAVFHVKQSGNKFITQIEGDERKSFAPAKYDRMIFKPHVGEVRYVSQQVDDKKKLTQYTYSLKTPSLVKKMFRGYKDEEFTPFLVPAKFLDDHNLLQFSRWKMGEAKRAMNRDEKALVSRYYGGRGIVASQWLASAPESERSFYAVQFAHQGTDALAALVCIAEGEVVSTFNYHGTAQSGEIQSIWFVDDEGDFMEHIPEIQCMVATPKGLEIYIRQFGGESVSYRILREVGRNWMELSSEYEIYYWD